MSLPKQQRSFVYKNIVSSIISESEIEIARYYGKCDETKVKGIYLQILIEIKETVSLGNLKKLKKLCKLIATITNANKQTILKCIYESDDNPIKDTNLVILVCKHGKEDILKYIFSSQCKILENLSTDIGIPSILPNDKDDECHNSVYYAIRSNNVSLFDTHINMWPNDHFGVHVNDLDEILSKAYDEVKLKNIPLSDKMQTYIEAKLINLRFFSDIPEDRHNIQPLLDNIKERIKLTLEVITMLIEECSSVKEITEKFLFAATFIAKNLHILKKQLKPTYDQLPWEEMEFCLISFIRSKTTRKKINLVCISYLPRERLLKHLKNFASKLNEIEVSDSNIGRRQLTLRREKVVAKIINNYHPFKELYDDHEKLADIHSLDKISKYIGLASAVNPREEQGRLVITRALQVTGEYLKNTLESPNLSTTTIERLLLSAPTNTREILIELRNSISHAHSLSKRIEIEENGESFFTNLQNDLKKIYNTVFYIHRKYETETCKAVLREILNNNDFNELKALAQEIRHLNLTECLERTFETELESSEKIKELIQELDNTIPEKTDYEQRLLDRMSEIAARKSGLLHFGTEYGTGILLLQMCVHKLCHGKVIDTNVLKPIAAHVLKHIFPEMKPRSYKEISEIAEELFLVLDSRLESDKANVVFEIIRVIFVVAQFDTDKITWTELLREKLTESSKKANLKFKDEKSKNLLGEKITVQLEIKLSTLKNILHTNSLNDHLFENNPSYTNNNALQASIEMLVQDIMSILANSRSYLTDDQFFLDDNFPLLVGRSLRNYLAHGNTLIDILVSDISRTIISNAKKLVSENVLNDKKYIGKWIKDVPSRLKDKCYQDLQIIANQKAMFTALEEGNISDLKNCMKKGADVYARNINLWTALHFAAKGPSLEIVKYIFSQNLISKDVDGQTPLHIAAAYGRKNIVEYFVNKKIFNVDDIDSKYQTSLHHAAQNGHKDVIEVLLKNGASTISKDNFGLSPVHHAAVSNYVDAAVCLLEKETNVDANEALGGFTPLHHAAKNGHLEMVNLLLEHKANVNARSDENWTPMHAAVMSGNSEIVHVLISKRANVKVETIADNRSPLNIAIELGHENITKILLKHGADVNNADIFNKVPLHHAAMNGQIEMVELLLKNESKVNVATIGDIMMPLHYAAINGHREVVELLLKNGALVNAKDNNGDTALHQSAFRGFKDVVELLIRNGAKIDSENKNNRTPLIHAAEEGNTSIVELLIAEKADVNFMSHDGFTALHLSALHSHIDIMKVLIRTGADINAKDKRNFTPLHLASSACSYKTLKKNILKDAVRNPNDDDDEKFVKILLTDVAAKSIAFNNITKGETVEFLLDHGANIKDKSSDIFSPLIFAINSDNIAVVKTLVQRKADVNEHVGGNPPLHLAVFRNQKEIAEILIENGADVNAEDIANGFSALDVAIRYNYKDIAKLLIAKGAKVNILRDLSLAMLCGYKSIIKILLNCNGINITTPENKLLLHMAAKCGFKSIVETLISEGADVNFLFDNHFTPLHFATIEGHREVVQVLLEKGAELNSGCTEGRTPLHLAAEQGHNDVFEVLLNNDDANINIQDKKNRRAVELAIERGHLQVVKTFLQHKDANIEYTDNCTHTLLHTAANVGNLEITRYLFNAGADVHAKNSSGLKPIDIAVMKGHKDVVDFFLNNDFHINSFKEGNGRLLLCYAVVFDQLEMTKYLLEKNMNANEILCNGETPMHIAARHGSVGIVEFLLSHGAVYNAINKFNEKPLDLAKDKNVINLLESTEKLFKAVKCNNSLEVERHIKAGAYVNAKSIKDEMPLHCAARKGYTMVVNVLMHHQSNPNVTDKDGFTALHYAAMSSHLLIIKALLSHGAIYNALTKDLKTPLDLAIRRDVINLLKLVEKLFKRVQKCDLKVIDDLKRVNEIEVMKALMNTCDRENKTLMVAAIRNDFPNIEMLKQTILSDVCVEIDEANILLSHEKYQNSINIYQNILVRKEKILGQNNPCILYIQKNIANALLKQHNYQRALTMFQRIYCKQKEILGENNRDALSTRGSIALVLCGQGKNQEALNIFQEVFKKQNFFLGAYDSDTLDTQLHMALVLNELKMYEEALTNSSDVFQIQKQKLGKTHPKTLTAQNNIVTVLTNQGNREKAMNIYKDVYEKRIKVLGSDYPDPLKNICDIAELLLNQRIYDYSLKLYQIVYNVRKTNLGQKHIETLLTQNKMANCMFHQAKWIDAFETYIKVFHQTKAILGSTHPLIRDTITNLQWIALWFKIKDCDAFISKKIKHIHKDIFIAAVSGEIKNIQDLLEAEIDVNIENVEGETPIHCAARYGHKVIVNMLLKNGADATKPCNEGNTSLHSATYGGNDEIAGILLQHVKQTNFDKFVDFINVRNISGSTVMHIATKEGLWDIMISLLNHGAIYNATNKWHKTPIYYSNDQSITDLLSLTDHLFECVKKGDNTIVKRLKKLNLVELQAVANARNNEGQTLLQIAIINKHKTIANVLIEMLQGNKVV